MNTIKLLIMVLGFCIFTSGYAQIQKDTNKTKKAAVEPDNFLDLGAMSITQILGENVDGKPTGKKLTFLAFLNTMDIPEDQKKEYRNLYYLQSKNLTEKQKDSLGQAIGKKIMEAEERKQ